MQVGVRGSAGSMVLVAPLIVVSALVTFLSGVTLPPASAAPGTASQVDALAGRCVTLTLSDGTRLGAMASPFTVRAAALGQFLFYGRDGRVLTADGTHSATLQATPTTRAIWSVTSSTSGFAVRSVTSTTSFPSVRVRAATGCRPFPDAELGVDGAPFTGAGRDGNLRGFVDSHAHLMAEQFLGGELH